MAIDASPQLDDTDWRILSELEKNARLSYAELGRTVNLSRPAVAERMRRLENLGVITGYRAEVNLANLGYGINAFVRITTQRPTQDLLDVVRTTPEVLEVYRGTGADSFILKVAVPSLWQLEKVLDKFTPFGPATASIVLSSVLTKRVLTEGIVRGPSFENGAGI
jgi:Lrp/AsnC family transcriptional regulator, leucine-responsive regulatory protein